jgi:hypothetical protein
VPQHCGLLGKSEEKPSLYSAAFLLFEIQIISNAELKLFNRWYQKNHTRIKGVI